jgi:hypothetical protein
LDSRTKGWVVHLHLCALIDNLAGRVAIARSGQALLVVVDVMLGVGDDALALNALDDRLDQDETEVRILARAAEDDRENTRVRKRKHRLAEFGYCCSRSVWYCSSSH